MARLIGSGAEGKVYKVAYRPLVYKVWYRDFYYGDWPTIESLRGRWRALRRAHALLSPSIQQQVVVIPLLRITKYRGKIRTYHPYIQHESPHGVPLTPKQAEVMDALNWNFRDCNFGSNVLYAGGKFYLCDVWAAT